MQVARSPFEMCALLLYQRAAEQYTAVQAQQQPLHIFVLRHDFTYCSTGFWPCRPGYLVATLDCYRLSQYHTRVIS